MKFKEIERLLLDNGWIFKSCRGSHNQYVHPTEAGQGNDS